MYVKFNSINKANASLWNALPLRTRNALEDVIFKRSLDPSIQHHNNTITNILQRASIHNPILCCYILSCILVNKATLNDLSNTHNIRYVSKPGYIELIGTRY